MSCWSGVPTGPAASQHTASHQRIHRRSSATGSRWSPAGPDPSRCQFRCHSRRRSTSRGRSRSTPKQFPHPHNSPPSSCRLRPLRPTTPDEQGGRQGCCGMNDRSWRDLAACLDVVSADYDPFLRRQRRTPSRGHRHLRDLLGPRPLPHVRSADRPAVRHLGRPTPADGPSVDRPRPRRPNSWPSSTRWPSPGKQDPLQARPSLQRRQHLLHD
jgi:hypothetical protein